MLQVVLGDAAVHLQGADGGDDHGSGGLQAGLAALDVEELLRSQVGAEAGFGHHVVGELQRGRGGDARSCSRGRCWRTGRRGRTPGCSPGSAPGWAAGASFSNTVIAPSALRSRGGDGLLVARVGRRRCCRGALAGPSGRWRGRTSP